MPHDEATKAEAMRLARWAAVAQYSSLVCAVLCVVSVISVSWNIYSQPTPVKLRLTAKLLRESVMKEQRLHPDLDTSTLSETATKFDRAAAEYPWGVALSVATILGGLFGLTVFQRRRRQFLEQRRILIGRATNTCPACGYDLTDLPLPRCPECGRDMNDVISPT